MTSIRIYTTDYEGDDFPEASSYPEYVAKRALELLGPGFAVEVESGASQTRVFGFSVGDERERDFCQLVKSEWWDEFCAHGYKPFTAASRVVSSDHKTGDTDE